MDSSSLKPLILKFVSEGPYLQDFTFCIFWYLWQHTIIFCWNFDWDPKFVLGPLLVRCELFYHFMALRFNLESIHEIWTILSVPEPLARAFPPTRAAPPPRPQDGLPHAVSRRSRT